MRGAVLHAPGDIRVEQRPDPTIERPPTRSSGRPRPACAGRTWALPRHREIRRRGPDGHEYVGIVEEVGSVAVRNRQPDRVTPHEPDRLAEPGDPVDLWQRYRPAVVE
jgi:threonine dehydrogenase-like Zn-dependent dehydrogenase